MDIWNFIDHKLKAHQKAALIIIVDTKGSSPGKKGFKMAVAEDGELKGSVGGGSAEYNAVEMARKILQTASHKTILQKQVHSADAENDNSGMICSGEQTYAIIKFENQDATTIQKIAAAQQKVTNSILELSNKGLRVTENQQHTANIESNIKSETDWSYKERIGLKDTLYIFGGGHVSVQLSKVMQMLGFYVKIYDNRQAISTMKENRFAHEKHIIDFKKAGNIVPQNDNTFVVIMTVGHMHDFNVLKQMAGKKIKYLGMMGSKSKVETIHQLLAEAGFQQPDIDRIHMPIGEPIHSHTPAEIAVSISAEIIKVKNSR